MIRRLVPGALTFLLLGLVIGGAFAGLLRAAGTFDDGSVLHSRYTQRVVTFTVWQALLSTMLSVGPAILVARLRQVGMQPLRQTPVPVLNMSYHANSFSYWLAQIIRLFVVGRQAGPAAEAEAWLNAF